MKKSWLVACIALGVITWILASTGTSSRAANTPAPTPMVSVTTLPALPSPGVPTAHPVAPTSSAPVMPASAAPAAAHPGQTPAMPPPGTFILVNGAVAQPQYVTLDQLQKMRSTSITQKIQGHGIVTVTGVPLAAVIALAQPSDTGGTDTSPNAYVLITGTQSQTALVAFPEFEKAFAGKIVLLAYLLNGKPPKAGAATLVVQGDASSGRFIEGVSHILIVQPSPSP
jgi:DMSO/TMAO reductase YedYZ molybdopterin-dependent catalytic subunit